MESWRGLVCQWCKVTDNDKVQVREIYAFSRTPRRLAHGPGQRATTVKVPALDRLPDRQETERERERQL
jgi:hypothetical protein